MKILILFFSVLLTITAQAQQIDIRLVTAEVASARVNSDQSERHYHVTVKLRHTGNSPLTSGDTITLMGRGNIICKRIVGPDFPFYDSSIPFPSSAI